MTGKPTEEQLHQVCIQWTFYNVLMEDTILTSAHKVAACESENAISKVLPILAPVCPSLSEQDWGGGGKRLENEDKFSLTLRKQKSKRNRWF